MKIKLININVWWGGKHLWNNLVDYLKKEQPDIVIMQEAFDSTEINVPEYLKTTESLKQILGFPYSEYGEELVLDNGDLNCSMGNAMLSKFELSNKHVEFIHRDGTARVDDRDRSTIENFPRNILHCQTNINGTTYNLMGTHGVWAPDKTETPFQKESGKKIAGYIAGKENIILTGDFNVNENTETINLISEQLNNIFKGERVSSFNMKQKTNPGYATGVVDFIFTSPNIKILEHRTAEEDVSDHQSQVVILDL